MLVRNTKFPKRSLISPPLTINAAAPDGAPPQRISDENLVNPPVPLCLGEVLRRGMLVNPIIFY
jgi:hypothetical protein